MMRLFAARASHVVTVALLSVLAGCGGGSSGLETDGISLKFVDGPADHAAGGPIPTFRVWVLDVHARRLTGLAGGTLSLDLIDPGGAVRVADFATVPLSFGEGMVVPSVSLEVGTGYSVRARYDGTTGNSPPFYVVASPDVVRTTNTSAGEMGLVVDGANNIGLQQDITKRTSSSDTEVGVLNSGSFTQAVAVFAPDRRPELVPVSWTAAADILPIELRDPVSIPVTVWIVGGSFATASAQVTTALTELNEVWRRERMGVVVGDTEFMDATPLATDFELVAIGLGAPFGPLQDGVGRAASRFNIYVVSQIRVDGELVEGFSETPGTAMAVTADALASDAMWTVGHEFGHNFGLRDTPEIEGFEIDANMMRADQKATVLTEGQTFRAHFDRSSPLRGFRDSDTFQSVSCDPTEATAHCPELAFRIWPESTPAPG